VFTSGIVVATKPGTGYWLQQVGGGAYSGLYIFDPVNLPSVGDAVDLTGEVDEYFGLTEIKNVSLFSTTSVGNSYTINYLTTTEVNDEMWEGVMVSVSNATCNAAPNGFGEWYVNDGSGDLQIDDFLYPYTGVVSTSYSIIGVVSYSFGSYELYPRNNDDIQFYLDITQIQTPGAGSDSSLYKGDTIATAGVVTATSSIGFWLQNSIGGAYSGVFVFNNTYNPSIGDFVDLVGEVDEYNSLTEIKNVSLFYILSNANPYTTRSCEGRDAYSNSHYELRPAQPAFE